MRACLTISVDDLSDAARQLAGKGRLTEANIKDTLRQVRLALLEADVALPVVKSFVDRIRERALGEEVGKSLTPGSGAGQDHSRGTGAHPRQ